MIKFNVYRYNKIKKYTLVKLSTSSTFCNDYFMNHLYKSLFLFNDHNLHNMDYQIISLIMMKICL